MIGTSLSHYRITEKLGQGGMGEVYRAEDTNLSRQVAIKVLPDEFAHDAERLARFEREAKLLASLNHPNIAAIHGLEEHEGKRFLVLELVEGQTLAERLKKGRMPLDETLDICRQIAEGLEAAHEKGVIHRDLKPANVKVAPEGKVKILDFGLAKAFYEQAAPVDPSRSPTITEQMTAPGVILGTAAYMSPEQARGKTVDKRADIWAFGCVLYECLTAKRAFQGDTITETVASILKSEPDWTLILPDTPAVVRSLLTQCLQKEPGLRLHDVADARIVIQSLGAAPEAQPVVGKPRQLLRRRLAQLTVAVLFGLAFFYILRYWLPRQTPVGVTSIVRFSAPISDPVKSRPMLAVSPDGSRLAYVARAAGERQIFLRGLDQFNATPLDGTGNAIGPFFSPDGQWIGFFADGKLKKVPAGGGAAIEICRAVEGLCGSWGADDTIVFVPRFASNLLSVPASGGTPKSVTKMTAAKGELGHLWPQILPGGKAVLFTIHTGDITSYDDAQIAVQVMGRAEPTILIRGGSFGRYVATGHLVYARKGTLLAVPFDLGSLQVQGMPRKVLDDVLTWHINGTGHFAVSEAGTLAYLSGGSYKPDYSLVTVDRQGTARPLLPDRAVYRYPSFAPDGRIAVLIAAANDDIWLFDPGHPGLTRFTHAGGDNGYPVWTPSSDRIIFSWGSTGVMNLFCKNADGSGQAESLVTAAYDRHPGSVSPDGNYLAFWEANPSTRRDIYLLPLKGERRPQPFAVTPFDEWGARFSPNGRWIAYTSDESGREEIYLQPVQNTGGKRKVSSAGGQWPVWAHTGSELFFLNGNKLLAANIDPASGIPGAIREHFELRNLNPAVGFDVAPDGRGFVMVVQDEQRQVTELRVILNWFEELKRLCPTK